MARRIPFRVPPCNLGQVHSWAEPVVPDYQPYRRYCRNCGLVLVGPWDDVIVIRKRKLAEAGFISDRLLRKLLWLQNRDGPGCFYCGGDLGIVPGKADQGTMDHYVPLSRGGSNKRENLRACCLGCNAAKGDMMPDEFLARIASRSA